ncbi:MAG TPA: cellobiose phosphorylase, partial [Anaerolineae bacterium]
MGNYSFDDSGRFVIEGYASLSPFASFLPGIAGPLGIPLWAFYVNRGQAIAGFGVESKDKPIMEYQPANKAYQTTPLTGFRTFIKLRLDQGSVYYEPFSSTQRSPARTQRMYISANELEVEETDLDLGLQFRVVYFVLP